MTSGMRTIIYPVKDLDQARALYGHLLGVEPAMDAPYYVQFNVGDQAIGLDPNGHAQGMTGPLGYWHVDNIQAAVERLVADGAALVQGVRDVGGSKQVAVVQDPDGNTIGLTHSP